jgi:exoribonuclease II
VRVRITGTDALTLDVHANLLARLDEVAASTAAEEDDSEAVDAAPLALAIDLNEPEPAATTTL